MCFEGWVGGSGRPGGTPPSLPAGGSLAARRIFGKKVGTSPQSVATSPPFSILHDVPTLWRRPHLLGVPNDVPTFWGRRTTSPPFSTSPPFEIGRFGCDHAFITSDMALPGLCLKFPRRVCHECPAPRPCFPGGKRVPGTFVTFRITPFIPWFVCDGKAGPDPRCVDRGKATFPRVGGPWGTNLVASSRPVENAGSPLISPGSVKKHMVHKPRSRTCK